MKNIVLGNTGIVTPQNAFGALPVQRVDMATAVKILRTDYLDIYQLQAKPKYNHKTEVLYGYIF